MFALIKIYMNQVLQAWCHFFVLKFGCFYILLLDAGLSTFGIESKQETKPLGGKNMWDFYSQHLAEHFSECLVNMQERGQEMPCAMGFPNRAF